MGSILDYIECPRCKQENCVDDIYYKTGEESIFCPNCGYQRSFFYKEVDGKYLKKDESKGYEFENLVSEEVHIENPYGVYRVESTLGGASLGTLETEEDYEKFVSEIKTSLLSKEHNIKEVVVSRLVSDKIQKEILFSNDIVKDS